jgi:hypothetical protein
MTLVALAPIGLWFAMGRKMERGWLVASTWLLSGVFLGVLPFTLRNLIASGRFVVLVNSWIQIPYFLIPPEVAEKPIGVPSAVEAIRMASGIFARDPTGTLWVEIRKVLFTFGLTTFGPRGETATNALAVLPPLFAVSVWYGCIPTSLAIALVTFVVSHVLAMVLAAPWTFHLKSILPLHASFLFGAAYMLQVPRLRVRSLPSRKAADL